MFAFVNDRQSCYLDAVLVCMFSDHEGFDFLWEHRRTPVARLLHAEATRLQQPNAQGWACTDLRAAMGSPWDTPTTQSAVDFFHALLDKCDVESLGYQTEKVIRTPRDRTKSIEVEVLREQGFRVHLAVAGVHTSLAHIFSTIEFIDVPTSEFVSIQTLIDPTLATVLVIEVGRNDSTLPISYGDTTGMMQVGEEQYELTAVVCRKAGHYNAFIRKGSEWWFYDDLLPSANFARCTQHPEHTSYKPSRYGELFFYK
jgi:hypothetical protein